jgi:hypothetical protein
LPAVLKRVKFGKMGQIVLLEGHREVKNVSKIFDGETSVGGTT